jgi:hypothetical protein
VEHIRKELIVMMSEVIHDLHQYHYCITSIETFKMTSILSTLALAGFTLFTLRSRWMTSGIRKKLIGMVLEVIDDLHQ